MIRSSTWALSLFSRLSPCILPTSAAELPSSSRFCSTTDSTSPDFIGNEKVQKLASEIINLTVLEASWLSEILRKKLNISKPAFGSMAMAMPAMGMSPGTTSASSAPPTETTPPVEKKEKTEFEVKLESFTSEGKIKVIKEVRSITNLGLKEAKELVEKAPVVVKSNVPKADAEAMKKQIEAAGAKVALE